MNAHAVLTVAVMLFAQADPTSLHAAGPQGEPGQVPVLKPGAYSETFRQAGEAPVRYGISIPEGYSPARPVPLVLALHFGGNPHGAGEGLLRVLVGPGLADLGAIIIAPDVRGRGWATPENERVVDALLDAVQLSYRIDPRRIAVTGFSMGGAGVWHFAGKYPERFSAAIPIAGRPPASPGEWRTPVLAIHSRDDEVVPIGPTDARIRELRQAGVRAELIVVGGIAHHETHRFVDGLRRAVRWLRDTWK